MHTQLPDEEDGQNADGEITQRGKRTIHIGHGDDNLDIHARALNGWVVGGASPEILKRFALQQHDEHEDETGYEGEEHDQIEDPDVHSFNRDSKEEDADRDLAADRGEAVCDFAEPPVLLESVSWIHSPGIESDIPPWPSPVDAP